MKPTWKILGITTVVGLVAAAVGVTSWAAEEDRAGRRDGELARLMGFERPGLRLVRAKVARLKELRDRLDLTDDQKTRIAKIIRSQRAEIVGAVKALREEQKALMKQVRADEVDERAIRRAALGMADAIADASVLRARVRKEVREALTPEQRREVDECLEDIEVSVDQLIGGLGTQNR